MKKKLLIVMGIIPLIFPSLTTRISIGILNDSREFLGSIRFPIYELPFIIVYILLIKLVWQFNFGFTIKKWAIPIVATTSMLATVVGNIVASKSLDTIFHQLPIGQIFVALIVSLVSSLIIGLFEETIFRGVIFNYFSHVFRKSNYQFLYSALLSSLIFGLIHLDNTLYGGQNLAYTLYQVIYAAAMGFLFAAVYVKTKSIIVPIILHALIDWSDLFFNLSGEPDMSGANWLPISVTLTLTVLYIASDIIIYRSVKNEKLGSIGFK